MSTAKRTIATVAVTAGLVVPASATLAHAADGPNMQLPFPCGQTWTGNNSNSSAHRTAYEIDFNRGATAEADRGDTVVAAAAGTVVTAANQGEVNGYGNLVKIDHGAYSTYYAHLDSMAVKAGQKVAQGQKIGAVGRTTKSSRAGISSHLHFEVRKDGASYPGSIVRAVFNGVPFTGGSITSKNCGTVTPQPVTPPFPGAAAFKIGQAHDAVLTLDQALIRKGYTRHNDGNGYQAGRVFTEYTRLNVQDFQKAQGWSGADADGYPGPTTWERLMK